MGIKVTLAAAATAVAAFCFVPQAASAAPAVGDTKQATKSNVEKVGYYGRRHYRHRRYYRGGYGYGHRRYYRRPGFGIYLGF
jgi:hypothetical protein